MTAVSVTGIGVVSALGHGVEPFWRGLLEGTPGLRPIHGFPALGGEVPALEAGTLVRTPIGRRIDRVSLLALAACRPRSRTPASAAPRSIRLGRASRSDPRSGTW